jgi:hypothetical protein
MSEVIQCRSIMYFKPRDQPLFDTFPCNIYDGQTLNCRRPGILYDMVD